MMTLIQSFVNQRINIKLVTSCILSIGLVATPVALADYTPSPDSKPTPPPSSDSGTRRGGGCDGGDMPLTVLAPHNYIGQTVSVRPTFAWFVPGSRSFEMDFIIYEMNSGGEKVKEVSVKNFQSYPGIMTLSPFDNDAPGLEVGKQYLWEIAIHCDPSTSDNDLVDEARLEVVKMPPTLPMELDKAINSDAEKANIYGEAGLWYDAFAEALKLAEVSKLGEVGSALLRNLAQWEAPETTPELIRQKCKQPNSGQEGSKVIPQECRRNNLEQIADSAR